MTIAAVTNLGPNAFAIELLASATATNSPPSGSSAGLDAAAVRALIGAIPANVRVAVQSTAGSATMTVTLRLWIHLAGIGWVVGKVLNGGSAVAETSADGIGYSEEVTTIAGAARYYLEITAIGGTSTAITGYLIVAQPLAA